MESCDTVPTESVLGFLVRFNPMLNLDELEFDMEGCFPILSFYTRNSCSGYNLVLYLPVDMRRTCIDHCDEVCGSCALVCCFSAVSLGDMCNIRVSLVCCRVRSADDERDCLADMFR